MFNIILSDFAKRQTRESRFSYFAGSEEDLLARVAAGMPHAKPGYRPGVVLVPMSDTSLFYSSTVVLKEGDVLSGTYSPRRSGETPRKQVGVVGGTKMPAARVDVVLYHRDVLAEGNENTPLPDGSTAEWEIVSISACPTLDAEPMTVGTLLANHFHEAGSNDGGTSTGMTDAELVQALRVSVSYWRDKATVA